VNPFGQRDRRGNAAADDRISYFDRAGPGLQTRVTGKRCPRWADVTDLAIVPHFRGTFCVIWFTFSARSLHATAWPLPTASER
jgi:hypothetical protein